MYDIFDKIEDLPENEIEKIFRDIMQKVEAFAKLMKLDPKATDYFRQIAKAALSLYLMMEENMGSLKEGKNLEDCIALLGNIESSNANRVAETMYLSREISREIIAKSGSSQVA